MSFLVGAVFAFFIRLDLVIVVKTLGQPQVFIRRTYVLPSHFHVRTIEGNYSSPCYAAFHIFPVLLEIFFVRYFVMLLLFFCTVCGGTVEMFRFEF